MNRYRPVRCVCGHVHEAHAQQDARTIPYGGAWRVPQRHSGACTTMIGFERCTCAAFKAKARPEMTHAARTQRARTRRTTMSKVKPKPIEWQGVPTLTAPATWCGYVSGCKWADECRSPSILHACRFTLGTTEPVYVPYIVTRAHPQVGLAHLCEVIGVAGQWSEEEARLVVLGTSAAFDGDKNAEQWRAIFADMLRSCVGARVLVDAHEFKSKRNPRTYTRYTWHRWAEGT